MTNVASTIKQKLTRQAPADKYVIWVVLGLAAIGIVAVYSAITFLAETKAGGNTEAFLWRHLVRVGLALGVMGVVSFVDYRTLARFSKLALIGALGLLLAVQIVGVASGGAERWIRVGSFGFQPSDLAKVALVMYIAVLLTQKQTYIKSFTRSFLPLLVWVLLTVALIGVEDLSTAFVVLVTAMLMCFVGRVSFIQLSGLALVGAGLAVIMLMGSPHRAARIEAYLGMDLFPNTQTEQVFDRQAEGYQADQARIAIAMGGLTGVGPGKSIQRDFLPAPYNDFIFAIITEEYGLVRGAMGLLLLFSILLFRGLLRIARHAPDPLGLFLGVGFTVMVALYGFIHAGVASGLLPVTGLPMPLVSYGGTSMVTTGFMLGVLLNISRQARPSP
ncbi:MAG: FtsW/RodA/SpoVE family cell cycle protein [Bacteroidetes bacterium]|jgi:cell division protein FtsW|nr:FtsW/RodA/SpoVE family cell cycle protein [Bacteroidota bacterium]